MTSLYPFFPVHYYICSPNMNKDYFFFVHYCKIGFPFYRIRLLLLVFYLPLSFYLRDWLDIMWIHYIPFNREVKDQVFLLGFFNDLSIPYQVCTMLKDSQFLNVEASDSQVWQYSIWVFIFNKPFKCRVFHCFLDFRLLEGRVLHKGAWVATLLGILVQISNFLRSWTSNRNVDYFVTEQSQMPLMNIFSIGPKIEALILHYQYLAER